ncbi:uncharacterized protein PV06_03493 [Exophiala oligosperma]|uniref:Zn(2)-C6 fungal-type domain-containing protein n=1 Tax=Exophiala oligosperma TaxID=215243 RepID=A0A0D2AZ25_9EURO|nr:uncharacterized protein PV06_03493 [Exophiala oligosperma]KIW45076.1 hypothetical protein PV06_03493 [Exophiala oligosperma]
MASINGPYDRSTSEIRRPRACIPCHERKVKCNASFTGLPCSRCIQHGRVVACEWVPLPDRSSARRKSRKRPESSTDVQQRPLTTANRVASNHAASSFILPGDHSPSNSATCSAPTISTSATSFRQFADGEGVTEEDSQLETCLRIARAEDDDAADPDTESSVSQQGREVFTYHGGVDPTTILGQALSHQKPRRFVRLLLRESKKGARPGPGNAPDIKSVEYLQSVGAYDLPLLPTCEKLVRLWFQRLYPYLPVLDRLSFMKQLSGGRCSTFLLQCIFASVVPYASSELLADLGYADRSEAQKSLFFKAQLLYDLGGERSQTCILQGSLILTSQYFAFGLDKDLRYWLSNAVRIATQMGLHRKQIVHQLDPGRRRLFSRIFWVMYSRDIIMVMAGRLNIRALDDRFLDMPDVTEEDWEDESDDQLTQFGLAPISSLEKSFLVHYSRLARISARYVECFRRPDITPMRNSCDEIEACMVRWREGLPLELRTETVLQWSRDNIWILVLRALAYRFECLFYRDVSSLPPGDQQDDFQGQAAQKQQNAMLELDSILRRVMLYDLIEFCPFSITTCASAIIAMHIEHVLGPKISQVQRQLSLTSIHSGLAFLRASSKHWDSVRWSLRMFDAIVARARLRLASSEDPLVDQSSTRNVPSHQSSTTVGPTTNDQGSRSQGTQSNPPDLNDINRFPFVTDVSFSEGDHTFHFELTAEDAELEGNFDEIMIEDMFSTNSLQTWAYGL